MDALALELRKFSKRVGDFYAVLDISLSVPPGFVYGFFGPNGAGKTTHLRMILDTLWPASGTVRILGVNSALHPAGPGAWDLTLREGGNAQAIPQACFQRDIRLDGFRSAEPSLHDVLVHLVGPEAREAVFR